MEYKKQNVYIVTDGAVAYASKKQGGRDVRLEIKPDWKVEIKFDLRTNGILELTVRRVAAQVVRYAQRNGLAPAEAWDAWFSR